MTGRTLTLSVIVALTQARAIVTNHCPHAIYVWSVPQVGSSHTDNLPIKPGGRYEEPWRYGSSTNPGVAIKISPQANGIYEGKDEINFAYSIEHTDKSKIWVDLSPVRGKAFDNNVSFHTCHGSYQTADVHTRQCLATDDIELVLCDTIRTSPDRDTTPFVTIFECYDYHHISHELVYEQTTSAPYHIDETKYGQPKSTHDYQTNLAHLTSHSGLSSAMKPSSTGCPQAHTSATSAQAILCATKADDGDELLPS